eukprot:s511_g9.t1
MCCSRRHIHPETQQDVPCDRELVFATLQQWFGRPGDAPGKYLVDFNRLVRKELAPSVLKSVGRDHLPVWYTLYMAAWGVSAAALDLCDAAFTVPLPGLSESLNVSVAVAVCAHFAAFRRREALALAAHESDLEPREVEELQKSYAERSRDRRFAASLRASRARRAREESEAAKSTDD